MSMLTNTRLYIRNIRKTLLEERQQWFLWIPVFYAIGILIYFGVAKEPEVYSGITGALVALSSAVLFRKKTLASYIFIAMFFVMSGFSGANIRAIMVKAPALEKPMRVTSIQGKVEEIDTYKTGYRIILTNIKNAEIPEEKLPKKIRLVILSKMENVQAGDVIEVRASLTPPPKAVLPGAYDFSQYAYFRQIGAVGFAVSDVIEIESTKNTFAETIVQIRNNIAVKIQASVGGVEAEIAKALFIGDTGGIDKDVMTAIRNSGLAHLLSISGLHLVLVCGIFFVITRTFLALIPAIALNYNIKKIAAIFAIAGSYFYLLISGSPVSAVRSFIMSAMALLAILLDRSGTPLRLVAIAAMFILIISPENILSPSFQMSFGAVIALIASFEWLTPHLNQIASAYKIPKIIMNIFGTIISSIVATIATAPFGVYHFNRSSPYGIIANVLAIPITSMLIMPLGVISLLLMPFHLEWLVAWPMKTGIDFIVSIARYVADLPYANSTIAAINYWQLLLITLGFLWLAIWKTKWRLFGFVFVVIACVFAPFNKTPDIIINSDATLFAVKDENGELIVSSTTSAKYARDVWSAKSGQEDALKIDKSGSKVIVCDSTGCIYKKNNYTIAIIQHPIALESECKVADVFINLTDIKYNCTSASTQVNNYNLRKNGAHEIFLGDKINVRTVSGDKYRIWD